jgi:hypothetical protein
MLTDVSGSSVASLAKVIANPTRAEVLDALLSDRALLRWCLDWTEQRPHLAGRLGAAICSMWIEHGLVQRLPSSRAVRVTPAGEQWLGQL